MDRGRSRFIRECYQRQPVCLKCITPHSPLQHFCEKCGETVGQFTPYIPYLNIPFEYGVFDTMWKRMWYAPDASLRSKMIYGFLIVVCEPIMLLGLPFIVVAKLKRSQKQVQSAE